MKSPVSGCMYAGSYAWLSRCRIAYWVRGSKPTSTYPHNTSQVKGFWGAGSPLRGIHHEVMPRVHQVSRTRAASR